MINQRKKRIGFCCLLLAFCFLFLTACGGGGTEIPTTADTDAKKPSTTTSNEKETEAVTTDQQGNPPTPTYDPPVVLNFSDDAAMRASAVSFASISFQNEEAPAGDYAFANVSGTDALSLRYNQFKSNSSFPAYRFTMKLTQANTVQDDSYYVIRVTYMTKDAINGQLMLINPSFGYQTVIVSNTGVSKGNFVTSAPVSIAGSDVLNLLAVRKPVVLGYTSELLNSEIYIKEILLFNSMAAAKAYGDTTAPAESTFAMTFGFAGNARMKYESGSKYGNWKIADASDVVSISYCAAPYIDKYGNYCIVPYLASNSGITEEYKYVRVSYKAKNPGGVTTTLAIVNPGNGNDNVRSPLEIADTGDTYALSSTLRMRSSLISRIASGSHFFLSFGATSSGGEYSINGLYFFTSKEDADSFILSNRTLSTVTIGDRALSDYKIVIPENAVKREAEAAKLLQNCIGMVSGVTVPIAVDTETEAGDYEILIGYTNRAESISAYATYLNGEMPISDYSVKSVGDKIVFATYYNFSLDRLVPMFAQAYLRISLYERPENINIRNCELEGRLRLAPYDGWSDSQNVKNPVTVEYSFDTEANGADANDWCEEGASNQWAVQNGAYGSAGDGYELTYLHVYEKNAVLQAELTPTPKKSGKGSFGLQLRYTSEYGYVRGGYDYAAGCWYIEYREGEDFSAFRVGTKAETLTSGTKYTLKLQIVNETATLFVNGVQAVSGTVGHLSPGRIAIYDNNVAVKADNVRVEFISGSEGHILTNITHTVLPDEAYREGGMVIELNDGNLHYIHSSGASFVSSDDGRTWERESSWYSGGYPSILRMQNGNLLKSVYEDGYSCMYTSTDDGKTWKFTGNVCKTPHEVAVSNKGEYTLKAGNTNDKLVQISTGRIFFVQNYESSTYVTIGTNDHIVVCCEIFYSDDNGKTWTQSKTASYSMSGLEGAKRVGELKVIECEGGVLRCLCTWNEFDCMFYSESTDNGVTWGPIQMMEEFKCSRSSKAIAHDPYGPTEYTNYMLWCYDPIDTSLNEGMPRSRLALVYTTDGINWSYLGDIWCWESGYTCGSSMPNHIVDPFIYVTEDAIIIGSGISEKAATVGEPDIAFGFHQGQRQHIWRIEKSSLTAYQSWPSVQY